MVESASQSIAETLPGICLNPQQTAVLAEMEAFLQSTERLHLLTGYAGTGKTTLLQALIKRLRQRGDRRSIVLSAFSNKATKVLGKMADRWNLGIDSMTCCKLLGLRPEIDPTTGKQVFRPDNDGENFFDRYQLIIVDEASMINEEMWLLLTTAASQLLQPNQILFVGDIAQLPPINEPASQVFSQIYSRSDLTEVVRYGGAIGVLAESIRNRLDNLQRPVLTTETNGDRTEGVIVAGRQDWEKLLIKAFQSESYRDDADYVRALAYTNARVNQLNQLIRAAIYGENQPRFVIGERLVASNPFVIDDAVLLQTSTECEVLDVAEGRQGNWHVWFLQVSTDDGKERMLQVLHELSHDEWTRQLKAYADDKRWQEFWSLKSLFADLNYAYCLTIHKAQGSTFQNVFVDMPNTLRNRNVRERNQLLYVAVTRAAKRLFILQ